jgi:hypothetical protein
MSISKKEPRKEKMRNSTACCDFARDDRDGYVTAEMNMPCQPTIGRANDSIWHEGVRKLTADLTLEQVYDNYNRCLEKLKSTKFDWRRAELEFIESVLSERIIANK